MTINAKLNQLLASYKKMLLDGGASLFLDEELYKWEYISDNQNSSALEIIDYLVKNNLNIYDRARDFQTWKTLKKVDSQALEDTIIKLKDESVSLVGYFYGHKNDYLILGDHYYWFMPLPENLAADLINRTTVDNLEFRDGAYYYKGKKNE